MVGENEFGEVSSNPQSEGRALHDMRHVPRIRACACGQERASAREQQHRQPVTPLRVCYWHRHICAATEFDARVFTTSVGARML